MLSTLPFRELCPTAPFVTLSSGMQQLIQRLIHLPTWLEGKMTEVQDMLINIEKDAFVLLFPNNGGKKHGHKNDKDWRTWGTQIL